MIWLLAPLSNSEFAQNVRDNYERQSAECRLVVVCNAGGEYGLEADAVLQSDPGKHNAISVGMRHIAEHGVASDAVCLLDQDDWYGPSSAQAKADALEATGADVVGAPFHWIRFEDGTIGRVSGPDERERSHAMSGLEIGYNDPWLTWGGSVAWRAGQYLDCFSPHHGGKSYMGDTQNWIGWMREAGRTFSLCEFPDVWVRHPSAGFGQRNKRRLSNMLPGAFTDHGNAPNEIAEQHWALQR